jgi:hypothetical protein
MMLTIFTVLAIVCAFAGWGGWKGWFVFAVIFAAIAFAMSNTPSDPNWGPAPY